jgi:predicted glycoside hydrolase/deacetylase ChbG (UPF0249 family)
MAGHTRAALERSQKRRPRLRCIVNADDLGVSKEVNSAIFAMMERGRVTSATILANGEAFLDAAARVHEFPLCSFGVHLNATEFKPVHSNYGLQPLLNSQGLFNGKFREVKFGAKLLTALRDEFSRQIEHVAARIGPISHIDSHHHVHTVPYLFPILFSLGRKYGIPSIRLSKNLYPPRENVPESLKLKKKIWNFAIQHIASFKCTDVFTDIDGIISNPCEEDCCVEIMTHPGHAAFEEQNRLLLQDWEDTLEAEVTFISYKTLRSDT